MSVGRRIQEVWSVGQRLWPLSFLSCHYHPHSQARDIVSSWHKDVVNWVFAFTRTLWEWPYTVSLWPLEGRTWGHCFSFVSLKFLHLLFCLSTSGSPEWRLREAVQHLPQTAHHQNGVSHQSELAWPIKPITTLPRLSLSLSQTLLLVPAGLCGWLQRKFQLLH